MNILILHGIGGYAGIHWQQWLHDELVKAGHNVIMPTLSNPDHPDRTTWLNEIKGLMLNLDQDNTVIVGHSLGVPAALDYIEQADKPVKGFVSVSGFHYPLNAELNDYFMKEKSIDIQKVKSKVGKASVLYGDDDPYVSQKALKDLSDELGVEPIVFHCGGHLNTDSGYVKFTELLEVVNDLEVNN